MKELTRVRYQRTDNGTLVSKEMLANEHVITVTIDTETGVYKLVDKQGELLKGGTITNLALTKKVVKEALKSYGVKFLDEVRTHIQESNEIVIGDGNITATGNIIINSKGEGV